MKMEMKTTSAAIKWAACLALGLLITGCAGLAASSFDKFNTVGRDVDEVIREIESKGFKCTDKVAVKGFTGEMIGAVNCGIREVSLACPDNYSLYLTYDLASVKVIAFSKRKRTNCF
jgi:hypothetical protein